MTTTQALACQIIACTSQSPVSIESRSLHSEDDDLDIEDGDQHSSSAHATETVNDSSVASSSRPQKRRKLYVGSPATQASVGGSALTVLRIRFSRTKHRLPSPRQSNAEDVAREVRVAAFALG